MSKSILLFFLSASMLIISCKTIEDYPETNEPDITVSNPITDTAGDTKEPAEEDRVHEDIHEPTIEPKSVEVDFPESGDAITPSDIKTKAMITAMPVMEAMSSVRTASPRPPAKIANTTEIVEAGQITAGEWNDLNAWDKWKELLKNQDYNEMQNHWRIFPRTRYSIFLTNQYELPLSDMEVELLTKDGKTVWNARTDNSGKAELWADIFNSERGFDRFDARVLVGDKVHLIEDLKTIEEGVNHLAVEKECFSSKNVDVLFVVDATGSMGDEIRYLQRELKDVIDRSSSSNGSLSLRTGAVFYRDKGDDYITQTHGFTSDANSTVSFIQNQSAAGGGDYPEAVHNALDEALSQDWSEEAISRIIFLLLDAPPHHNDSILTLVNNQIKEAAELGIKIIPITASGINRQTEFLMKFMAITTNGTYVFITDHSGIGNPHLDPVVQDFEVEKLNNLMVRLLYNYTKSNGCNANEDPSAVVKMYPNPTSNYINVNTTQPIDELKVTSNSGLLMATKRSLPVGETRIDLDEFVDGIYTISCSSESFEYSQPVILVSGR